MRKLNSKIISLIALTAFWVINSLAPHNVNAEVNPKALGKTATADLTIGFSI